MTSSKRLVKKPAPKRDFLYVASAQKPTSVKEQFKESLNAEGVKFDVGKLPIHLLPFDALIAICYILEFGARKYAERNWEKGMAWSRVFSALMRHMWAWWQNTPDTKLNFLFGEVDSETAYPHLWHAGCCILFLITYDIRKVGKDDRPGTINA